MVRNYPGEEWKTVKFGFEVTNQGRIEVSNFGRLRTFNKISDGNILNGSMVNGYKIIRLKLYEPREERIQNKLNSLQRQVLKQAKKLKMLKETGEPKKIINEASAVLEEMKTNLSEKFQLDLKERTINYHSLIHRLVALYFLRKPSATQTIVAHLDFDKLNNKASNLKWMTPEENYDHQQSSPHVIKDKQERRTGRKENSRSTKLTVTKVMLLKKLLNQNKPMKQLVRQFKITDTQILRIKRGENWSDVQAAK